MLAAALLALALSPTVSERVDSDPPPIEALTGGLIGDGSRLSVDLRNLFGDGDAEVELAGMEERVEQAMGEAAAAIDEERASGGERSSAGEEAPGAEDAAEWTPIFPAT